MKRFLLLLVLASSLPAHAQLVDVTSAWRAIRAGVVGYTSEEEYHESFLSLGDFEETSEVEFVDAPCILTVSKAHSRAYQNSFITPTQIELYATTLAFGFGRSGECGAGGYSVYSGNFFWVEFVPLVDVYYQIFSWLSTGRTCCISDGAPEITTVKLQGSGTIYEATSKHEPVGSSSGLLQAGTRYRLEVTTELYSSEVAPSPAGAVSLLVESLSDIKLMFSEVPIPEDTDGDGVPDIADAYPDISLDGRLDTDHDGIPNDCDQQCEQTGMVADDNDDHDANLDAADNCPLAPNDSQTDENSDGVGDACDPDSDGVADDIDNCPLLANADQADWNGDGVGDACDPDSDGVADDIDNCPLLANADQADSNSDGIGNKCDKDSDGVLKDADNCPLVPNPDQLDTDGDGRGDLCQDYPPGC